MSTPERHGSGNRAVFTKDLSAPDPIPEAGIEAAVRLMRDGRLFRYGEDRSGLPEAALLEEEFAALLGKRYCVAVNSGGAALYVALKSVGVEAGDPVLVNAFTLAPVPGAIEHAGARAVMVDIDARYVIDVDDLETKARASGARVLLLSYMRGHIPDMDRVMAVCDELGITVVEDCAHTLGATWRDRQTGTFGTVGCFSAQTFKHVNAGEGGLVVTDDEDVAARAILRSGSYMLYAQHRARPPEAVFERHRYTTPNCSMRMSALAAAVLRPQLALLPERIARWRAVHAGLVRALADVPNVEVPARPSEEGFVPSSLQFSVVGVDPAGIARFASECDAHGVHVKWFGSEQPVGFTSRHDHWRYLDAPSAVPTADRVLAGLCDIRLPAALDEADCSTIAAVLREAMQAATRPPAA
ncbi:MAG: aminotransferase class I/II-fold pyridoxal phosphate-dependent enzyme [Ectothiorhodospiraceae bacterium]|nr:aminotransferase class I/II-fold pyridoxal phosphate-dependent enzyme [Chromatiales bacterium]MCP5153299.1 aminotransferase class I/II-fold pyridoxal phosphate-dependent enzyme [Ectothiorhodospiraceae bacterium]